MSYLGYRSRSQVRSFDESPRVEYKPRSSSHSDIYRGIVSADIAMYTPKSHSTENHKRQQRSQSTKGRFLPGRTYISSNLTTQDLDSGVAYKPVAYKPRATYSTGVTGASVGRATYPSGVRVTGISAGRPPIYVSGSAYAAVLRSRLQTQKNSPGRRPVSGLVSLYRKTY